MPSEAGSIETKVISFIAQYLETVPERIKPHMEISRDLCLDGDEAEEFIVKFFEEFYIEWNDSDFSKYFCEEWHFNFILYPFVYLYYKLSGKSMPKLIDLKVIDLINAAKNRKWEANKIINGNKN